MWCELNIELQNSFSSSQFIVFLFLPFQHLFRQLFVIFSKHDALVIHMNEGVCG